MSPRHCDAHEGGLQSCWAVDMHGFGFLDSLPSDLGCSNKVGRLGKTPEKIEWLPVIIKSKKSHAYEAAIPILICP